MENIRPRLKFGNKIDNVKLRKRKSHLYSKKDECPLNNGETCIVKRQLKQVHLIGRTVLDFYFETISSHFSLSLYFYFYYF